MEEIIFWLFAPIAVAGALFLTVFLCIIGVAEFFRWFIDKANETDDSFSDSTDDL